MTHYRGYLIERHYDAASGATWFGFAAVDYDPFAAFEGAADPRSGTAPSLDAAKARIDSLLGSK